MSVVEEPSKMIGRHELRFMHPDMCHCALRGVLDEKETEILISTIHGYRDVAGQPLFAIYDLSEFGRLTVGVRNVALHGDYAESYAAVAIVGASFTTRTFVDMFTRAARLVSKSSFSIEYRFSDSTEAALAWFEELRSEKQNP